ncbi:hypothetical protein LRAMOSA05046 [Lichtheimia ramosa]|uniref:FAM192A/Fyv6 N-terminal domain-containing protein n=1 Tax=Lichtheimia ramosa TaxID=688394 RepID=A0A077X1C3_9FUNG|nr:hypothetical protein LRAMOSA05046 [Lichtheimia ramosa]
MKFVSRSIVDQDKELQINDQQTEQDSSKPQQEYDPRTLFERLQEQRTIKEEQFQEATRLSNLIKRVDDEEAEYFESLLDVQEKLALEQRQKEQDEIAAYRKAVEQTRTSAPELPATVTTPAAKKPTHRRSSAGSSKKALDGLVIVKKKRNAEDVDSEDEKKKEDDKADTHTTKKAKTTGKSTTKKEDGNNSNSSSTATSTNKPTSSVNTLSSLMAAYSSDSSDDDE